MFISYSKMGEENFSKAFVVTGEKVLISKSGRHVYSLKELQAIFGENRTLDICSIINNMLHMNQYTVRLIRGAGVTH